jgi:hypothetical protein
MTARVYPQPLIEALNSSTGLYDIFGTPEEQKKKINLKSISGNTNQIDKLKAMLPNNGVLDVYEEFGRNARPTFLEVGVKVIKMLEQSGIFKKYKLPELGQTMNRIGVEEKDWALLYLKYPVQREVKVWHILQDILIDWDDNLNDPAYVRVLPDNTMNVNDKQHGNFGRLIMGAEKVLVEGIASDDECMDSNMYAARNIHNLASSWESNANVRVQRSQDYLSAGRTVKEEDQRYLDYFNLLQEYDYIWVEGSPKGHQTDKGEKIFKLYNQYDKETVFKKAVSLNSSIWPTHGELSKEFLEGCCEFLEQMQAHGFNDAQMRDIISAIKESMKDTYLDHKKTSNRGTGVGTLWGSVCAYINTLEKKGENKDWRVSISAPNKIAAGLRDLIMNWKDYYRKTRNVTKLKLELPPIKDKDGIEFEVEVPYFPNGFKKTEHGHYRNSEHVQATSFNPNEQEFAEEEAE